MYFDGAAALEDAVNRRELLKAGLGIMATGAAVDTWERWLWALRQPHQIDPATITWLEQVTISLSQLERSNDNPPQLLATVQGHLETLASFLHAPVPTSARRQLAAIVAETAGLAGWLAWDGKGYKAAAPYFRAGLRAAHEAGDPAIGAYLAGSLACRPFYCEDPQVRLRALADPPFGFVGAHASPHTRAWLAALAAGGHALAGDYQQYRRSIGEAEELVAAKRYDGSIERPRVPFFDASYMADAKAASLGRLRRPEEARQVVEAALPSARGQFRGWLLLDLAGAYAIADQPEAAVEAAAGALTNGTPAQLQTVITLLEGMRTHRQQTAAKQLAEQADFLLSQARSPT